MTANIAIAAERKDHVWAAALVDRISSLLQNRDRSFVAELESLITNAEGTQINFIPLLKLISNIQLYLRRKSHRYGVVVFFKTMTCQLVWFAAKKQLEDSNLSAPAKTANVQLTTAVQRATFIFMRWDRRTKKSLIVDWSPKSFPQRSIIGRHFFIRPQPLMQWLSTDSTFSWPNQSFGVSKRENGWTMKWSTS